MAFLLISSPVFPLPYHFLLLSAILFLYQNIRGISNSKFHRRALNIGKDVPELWQKFLDWYNAVFAEGALSEREKALIALAVAHTVQCPYCIDAYSSACLEKGSDIEQMTEAIHVAAAIRGGSSLVHGVQMRNHVHKLSM